APRLLPPLLHETGACNRREAIDEDLADQTTHFVRDANGQAAVGRELEGLAPLALRAHGDAGGPPDRVVVAGYRKAALFALRFPLGGDDLRIDEHLELVAGLAHVDHDDALRDVDLRGGAPHARPG